MLRSSESESDSNDTDDGSAHFFGPFAGLSAQEKRRRLAERLGAVPHGLPGWVKKRKRRQVELRARKGRYEYEFEEGDIRRWRLDPAKSPWWELLRHPEVAEKGSPAWKKFRHKFRLPYQMAMELVERAQTNPEFSDGGGEKSGRKRHPLVLKVLAALRHLGKGLDAESLEEVAMISETVLKTFIPKFLKWLVDTMYEKWVQLPEGTKLARSLAVYERLGFPGAFCSADGVHVPWDRAPSNQHNLFVGKEGFPTVAWVVSVLHTREIIHISEGMPGHTNDKTHARHDALFAQLREGTLHPDQVYYLYNSAGERVAWKGLYAIVDNGFHQWRCLQAPFKHAHTEDALMWAKRMESVRKDSECTFGTMKNRFRVLRLPFLCNNLERVDTTFRACATLHNMLLHYDGYDTIGHRHSDWQTSAAEARRRQLDTSRLDRTAVRPPDGLQPGAFAVLPLALTSSAHFCCSSLSPLLPNPFPIIGVERESSFPVLREALVTHYEQARKKKEVYWPRTAAECRGHVADDTDEADEQDEWIVYSDDESN